MLFNDTEEEVVEDTETEEETEEVEDTEEQEEAEEDTETEKEEKPQKKTPETPEAKKARLERELKQVNKKLGVGTEQKPAKKSDDFGYDKKAYLIAQGIQDPREISFIQKELKKSGLELDALLQNGYFKAEFETFKAINKTSDATPKGKRSGGVATDSVEYWATKPIEEVPQEMRIKVVNYKLSKEQSSGVFYNSSR